MSVVINAVLFLLILSFVVIVHELGHFAVARICGVKVLEFAIGMGPVVFSKTRGETVYSVRAIPIGGFVRMLGENSEDEPEDGEEPLSEEDQLRSFSNKNPLQKLAILLAGIFNNLVIGIALMVVYFSINGSISNIVDKPLENLPAQRAGIQSGDRIIEIGGEAVNGWGDITRLISSSQSGDIRLVIERNGEILVRDVQAELNKSGRYVIGVTPLVLKDFASSLKASAAAFREMLSGTINGFASLFSLKSNQDIVGPIGLYKVVGDVREIGYMHLLMLVGSISISIGFVNLIPIPVLDGGRALIVLGEMLFRRKLGQKVEYGLMLVGIVLIFAMIGYAFYSDIARLISGAGQ